MGSKQIWLIIIAAFSVGVFLSGILIFEAGPTSISPGSDHSRIEAVPANGGTCC